jgi:hypothetical protein
VVLQVLFATSVQATQALPPGKKAGPYSRWY